MCRRKGLIAALAVAILCASTASWAQSPSLDRILPAVARQIPGEMLDARGPFSSVGGKQHYEIKWLTPDGRVFWLSADAGTGKVSG
jgi:hypothetical protein